MRYILTLILLVSLASCAEEPNLPVGEKAAYVPHSGTYIYKVTIEGHDYLYNYRTSMIHSESCKSPEHYDTK